jgi:hypothetical protein
MFLIFSWPNLTNSRLCLVTSGTFCSVCVLMDLDCTLLHYLVRLPQSTCLLRFAKGNIFELLLGIFITEA